jgi:hypothetical protein
MFLILLRDQLVIKTNVEEIVWQIVLVWPNYKQEQFIKFYLNQFIKFYFGQLQTSMCKNIATSTFFWSKLE